MIKSKNWLRLGMRIGHACLAAAMTALAIGCNGPGQGTTELPTPKVTVTEVVAQETTDYDDYVGRTEAFETVEVRSRVYGFIRSTEFEDGDHVTEGQTLFTIEPDEYDAIQKQSLAKIEVWESKANLAKTKLARNEKLVQTGSISKEEYDESVAAVKEAEASVIAAKADADRSALDLKYTVITAPISGRIDRALLTKGNLVIGGSTGGTLLTRIVQDKPMYVYFDVDEQSLLRYVRIPRPDRDKSPGSLRTMQIDCLVQLADEQDFPHAGKLDFAANQIDAGTGTIRIRGVLPNDDLLLNSGMFVRVRIPIGEPYQALLIPDRAIATDQGSKYVYVVDEESKAVRRDVTLGVLQGALRIVKNGLKAGEKVIVAGQQRVRPDQKVEPRAEAPIEATAATRPAMVPRRAASPPSVAIDDSPPTEAESSPAPAETSEPAVAETSAASPEPAIAPPTTNVEPTTEATKRVEVNKPATTKPRKREF